MSVLHGAMLKTNYNDAYKGLYIFINIYIYIYIYMYIICIYVYVICIQLFWFFVFRMFLLCLMLCYYVKFIVVFLRKYGLQFLLE